MPNLNSASSEDYLKAMYKLNESGDGISPSKLSDRLGVTAASVTGMLKKLKKNGYVKYSPYRGAALTKAGLHVALKTIRKHRLLERFFTDRLGMDWARAHEEAEILEHFISKDLEQLIDKELGHPDYDPHGDPIPTSEGEISSDRFLPLSEMKPGNRVIIKRVSDEDSELLKYYYELGLVPGTEIFVTKVAPFDGPLTINISKREEVIGKRALGGVFVEKI